MTGRRGLPIVTPTSAGMIEIDVKSCGGKSDSMGLSSQPSDGIFIQYIPYNAGIR